MENDEVLRRLESIERRLANLESRNLPLGPQPKTEDEILRDDAILNTIIKDVKERTGNDLEVGERIVPPVDRSKRCMLSGNPETPDHRELRPDGMQKDYVVLCPQERAKGFVRPVRRSYRHIGIRPTHPTRELTEDEKKQYSDYKYVLFEPYSDGGSVTGRFWTKEQLNSGCGTTTTMGLALAETYARDPGFYSGTFCCGCAKHLGLEEFVWEGTNDRLGT